MHNEKQRYGRMKETSVNRSYIESGDYRRKFDMITESASLNRLIYEMAKKMLLHRSGTLIEDMCWIDAQSETIIHYKDDERENQQISHSESIDKKIHKVKDIIAIHTHPRSLPPSAEDFNCFVENKYTLGLIICHNGVIYGYTAKKNIDVRLWERYVESAFEYSIEQVDIQKSALNKFVDNGDIDYWEVDVL